MAEISFLTYLDGNLLRKQGSHIKFVIILPLLFLALSKTASANSDIKNIRCINLSERDHYKQVIFSNKSDGRYKTDLYIQTSHDQMTTENLSPSRLYVLRNSVANINSLDLVVEFKLGTKELPANEARISLSTRDYSSSKWLCKLYF